jgi:hypothetical protein
MQATRQGNIGDTVHMVFAKGTMAEEALFKLMANNKKHNRQGPMVVLGLPPPQPESDSVADREQRRPPESARMGTPIRNDHGWLLRTRITLRGGRVKRGSHGNLIKWMRLLRSTMVV